MSLKEERPRMGTRKVSKMWIMALLLVGFVAGCGEERGVVPPTLTSISPNGGTQGQTEAVTLTGTNFTTGATINVSGALIAVTNTTVASSTQITATFAIAANAVLGAVNISVTSSGDDHQCGDVHHRAPTRRDFRNPHQWRNRRADQSGRLGNLQSGGELCNDYRVNLYRERT